MTPNIYYAPQEFGLETVGEVDFSEGFYEFDLTGVWRDQQGQLFYADDSGNSVPVQFEDTTLADLTACTPAELQAHLEQRLVKRYGTAEACQRWRLNDRDEHATEIADLMERVMSR